MAIHQHVDIVGVITLGMITALGGGIIRDVLLHRRISGVDILRTRLRTY